MQTIRTFHNNSFRLLRRLSGGLIFLAVGTVLLSAVIPLTRSLEPEVLTLYLGYDALLVFLAYSSFVLHKEKAYSSDASVFSVLRVTWFFLLSDDVMFGFGRLNALSSDLQGNFSSAAYGEVLLWVISAAILAVISLSRTKELVAALFTGTRRWMTLFLILCIVSVAYSKAPAYSLAWSFKLGLDVWMVALLSVCVHDESGIRSLLRTTALSIGIVFVIALLDIAIDPENAFAGGRLSGVAGPTVLSELGGLLLLISLVFSRLEKAKWTVPVAVLASVVMLLGGGKIAIVAALVSVGAFFALQRKAGTGILAVATLGFLAGCTLLVAPTGKYFTQCATSDQATTLTGRMVLWKAQWLEIQSRIVLGHGYMSSKFVPAPFKKGGWQVGSLHNAALDVLYNLGVVGLFGVVMMNYWIVRNLLHVRKHCSDGSTLAIANFLIAIYLDLLIDSPFAVPFGGRPDAFFMVFLAVSVVSTMLRESESVNSKMPVVERMELLQI